MIDFLNANVNHLVSVVSQLLNRSAEPMFGPLDKRTQILCAIPITCQSIFKGAQSTKIHVYHFGNVFDFTIVNHSTFLLQLGQEQGEILLQICRMRDFVDSQKIFSCVENY